MQHGLSAVVLSGISDYPGIFENLARLPPTLRDLVILLGLPGHGPFPPSHQSQIPVGVTPLAQTLFGPTSPPLDFPQLERLSLHGNIVCPASFAGVRRFPRIEHLTLGAETSFSPTDVDSLLPPAGLPSFRSLALDLGTCEPVERKCLPLKRRSSAWPSALARGADVARELFRRAEEAGVRIAGTVRCARGECDEGDGHGCLVRGT